MCSSSGGQIVLHSLWYHHTYRWPFRAQVERVLSQPVHGTATYRCDDTRGCVIQFDLLMMSTRARSMYRHEMKLIVKQNFVHQVG